MPVGGGIQTELYECKAAYPGDKTVETYRLLAIEVDSGDNQAATYLPVPVCRGGFWGYFSDEKFGWWGPDSRTAYFIDVERGAKSVRVVEV